MKKRLGTVIAATALAAGLASPAWSGLITEQYTGRQDVRAGEAFYFGFDLWLPNLFVGDSAPGLRLDRDGIGAFGQWTSGSLFIDFESTDWQREYASIDLDAWGFRLFGFLPFGSSQDVLTLSNWNISPLSGSLYQFRHDFSLGQLDLLDSYGGGELGIRATNVSGNDFAITRVGMSVLPVSVSEPSMLALLLAAFLAGVFVFRRRLRAYARRR